MTGPDRRPGRVVDVEFIGGHMDGATVGLPADPAGRPPAELRMLAPGTPHPAGWDRWPDRIEDLPIEHAERLTTYARQPVRVGGMLVGWRMVATLLRSR